MKTNNGDISFYGREEELSCLQDLWDKEGPSLVICSGRRRIGKSTLIEQFALRSKCRFIELVGLPPDEGISNEVQLKNFCERLAVETGTKEISADCWPKAFDALDKRLGRAGRTLVFLDEISWMGAYDKGFAGYLKNAWDTQFSKHRQLIVVVCGSVSSWIRKNILKSKGFVGRMSLELNIEELPLPQCRAFWGAAADRTSTSEILDVLSVTGGVPKYLAEVKAKYSAAENIRRMCFMPQGYLFRDFDRIFTDIFRKTASEKKDIVTCIAEQPRSLKEIGEKLATEPNGHLSEALDDLVQAGFVSVDRGINPATGRKVRAVRYRISDNYLRFFLKFVSPRSEAIGKGLFRFASLEQLPGWDGILSLQFENLVRNNLALLIPRLGLQNSLITSAAPYSIPGSKERPGLQIDLLIQTRKSICIVEIKRKALIDESIEDEVTQKIIRMGLPANKSVKTALVYFGRLSPQLIEDGYFATMINIEELL